MYDTGKCGGEDGRIPGLIWVPEMHLVMCGSLVCTGTNPRESHNSVNVDLFREIYTPQTEWAVSEGNRKAMRREGWVLQFKGKVDTHSTDIVWAVSLSRESSHEVWLLVFMHSVSSYANKWEEYSNHFGEGVAITRNWATTHPLTFHGQP